MFTEEKDSYKRVRQVITIVWELLQKKKAAFILRDLYDIGVIGNYGDFPRFSFKGEKDIDPLLPLTFHYPLLRYFKASIRNKENRLDVYK